jgi:hypothetical protein
MRQLDDRERPLPADPVAGATPQGTGEAAYCGYFQAGTNDDAAPRRNQGSAA